MTAESLGSGAITTKCLGGKHASSPCKAWGSASTLTCDTWLLGRKLELALNGHPDTSPEALACGHFCLSMSRKFVMGLARYLLRAGRLNFELFAGADLRT